MSSLHVHIHLAPSTVAMAFTLVFLLPSDCGSNQVQSSQCPVLALAQSSELQRCRGPGSEQWALSCPLSEVVSSSALITDERWVVLSGEDARMPRAR